jgi:hypothetical protein
MNGIMAFDNNNNNNNKITKSEYKAQRCVFCAVTKYLLPPFDPK